LLVVWLGIQVEYHSLLPELARGGSHHHTDEQEDILYWAGHPYKEGKVCACWIPAQEALLVRSAVVAGDGVVLDKRKFVVL
jgi:hypothetical protein